MIRLCANAGATLHLVEPLGFELSAYRLRRAGMDYAELAPVKIHPDWEACKRALGDAARFALTTKGNRRVTSADLRADENLALVFGCETSGLPPAVLAEFASEQRLRLPMMPGNRSINLSNTVAVTVYEAWRQRDFAGAD